VAKILTESWSHMMMMMMMINYILINIIKSILKFWKYIYKLNSGRSELWNPLIPNQLKKVFRSSHLKILSTPLHKWIYRQKKLNESFIDFPIIYIGILLIN
jgi:hypothetical protein